MILPIRELRASRVRLESSFSLSLSLLRYLVISMRWDVPSVADCTLHSHLHIFAVDPSPRPKIVGTDRKTNPRGDLLMRSIHLSLSFSRGNGVVKWSVLVKK